ncbi:Sensory box sensor histidine kinase/response regulator [Pseudomonas syringae pv. tagetis]|uniref:histidine kinase n=1 Tax=Pseudomonas syringae pv. tagetis TaxID=129140 RepID=A0A0Q0B632_9PSED|nr:Sensory box sensor histidine kinase/response regulator [Pseudomonas syringae pv. tagetis]RMW17271.1 Sensory box sensor histidine kinase/response regulator [Pseudomonas syringae pv. tagetis]RMW18904.1 Sensory box sensor histidine kinase/response regulator [Pseudomonas syringae pv. tagetis]
MRTGEPVRFERELVATGRYLALTAFRIEPASRRQVAVLFQDITERKRAELALQQLNETLEARIVEAVAERNVLADVVNGTNAFIHVVDCNYRWMAINGSALREFERLFGVRPQVGDNMLDLLDNCPQSKAGLEQRWTRALSGEEFAESVSFSDSKDPASHFELRYSTLRNAEGQVIGAYLFAYDVSERLREQQRLTQAEEALRQSQKMEAVGQLTGGIAHDFNNLLTGITGSLELLKTRMSQGRFTEIDRYIDAAQDASKRAASLTHRLLAFSRRQTLDPKPVDINRLVIGVEELIRRTVGPHITLEVVTSVGLWSTFIDAPQLENALLNLCINARDAMPRGGRITIETANRWIDERGSQSRDLTPGQYLSLCVSDTGTGM